VSLPPPLSPPSPTAKPLPDNINHDKVMFNDDTSIMPNDGTSISMKTTSTLGPISKIIKEHKSISVKTPTSGLPLKIIRNQALNSVESIENNLSHNSGKDGNDDNCHGDHDDEFIDFYNYGDNDGSDDDNDDGSNDGDNNNSNTVDGNIGNNHQLKSTIIHNRVVLCGKEIVSDSSEDEDVSTCSKVFKRRKTFEGVEYLRR
jgi:hypothetical protein